MDGYFCTMLVLQLAEWTGGLHIFEFAQVYTEDDYRDMLIGTLLQRSGDSLIIWVGGYFGFAWDATPHMAHMAPFITGSLWALWLNLPGLYSWFFGFMLLGWIAVMFYIFFTLGPN